MITNASVDLKNKETDFKLEQVNFFENIKEIRYFLYALSILSLKHNHKLLKREETEKNHIEIPKKFENSKFGSIFAYLLI